ncbi:GTP pyrophosphokinase [Pseudomonas quasicaspiana]|uniref:GTP pyrophosphokinase n=1 Tax=Pseudomonas quasicaspiana TaxID=2829821 RepID=UPI001E3EFD60|nr:GTP pyrophosphokinase [Pseudomonas quasicaspiana]MCD5973949.1 GTP pyrophosphokinase [Pseudomonas quasicaspiana]
MSILDVAIATASRVHAGQLDKAGKPYILHPLRLMMRFDDLEGQLVSLLHDVVEDGDVTFDDLRESGIPEAVVTAIDCLTKRPGEPYEQFITRIHLNPLATRVKIADIRDNLDLTRLPVLHDKDLERAAKYHRALRYLQEPSGL